MRGGSARNGGGEGVALLPKSMAARYSGRRFRRRSCHEPMLPRNIEFLVVQSIEDGSSVAEFRARQGRHAAKGDNTRISGSGLPDLGLG